MEKRIEKKYSGVIVPLVSPILADQTIDKNAVDQILKTFTFNLVDTFILGTTGESASISETKKTELVKYTVEAAQQKIKVYAGISLNCLEEAIDNGNRYADLGVNVLVAHLPACYPMSSQEMMRYFEELANNIKCPLILYNNPATARWSLPLDIIDKLSHHPNIVGIKDSERGLNRLEQSIHLWKSRPDFSYLLGWAAQSCNAVMKGCDGIVPSMGNLVPDLYKRLFDAAIEGNGEEAEKWQKITDELSEICQKNKDLNESLPALKVMLSAYNLCKPHVFKPMSETDDADKLLIEKQTKQIMESVMNLAK